MHHQHVHTIVMNATIQRDRRFILVVAVIGGGGFKIEERTQQHPSEREALLIGHNLILQKNRHTPSRSLVLVINVVLIIIVVVVNYLSQPCDGIALIIQNCCCCCCFAFVFALIMTLKDFINDSAGTQGRCALTCDGWIFPERFD